jgi:hypothetical protein
MGCSVRALALLCYALPSMRFSTRSDGAVCLPPCLCFLLQDYMDPNIPTKGFFTNVRYMFDLRDVVVDVQGEADHNGCGTCLRMFDQPALHACAYLSSLL